MGFRPGQAKGPSASPASGGGGGTGITGTLTAGVIPIATGLQTIADSLLSYAANTFNYQNSVAGGPITLQVYNPNAAALSDARIFARTNSVGSNAYFQATSNSYTSRFGSSETGQWLGLSSNGGSIDVPDLKITPTVITAAAALTSVGDFTVGVSKLTVAAASGNTVVAGTLVSTGDFAVGASVFAVVAATGAATFLGTASWGGTIKADIGATGGGRFSGALEIVGTSSSNSSAPIYWNTGSVAGGLSRRWRARKDAVAESGSNAGSNWLLEAIADDGSTTITTVITILRPSGGLVTIARPLTVSGALTATSLTFTGGSTVSNYDVSTFAVTLSGCTTVPSVTARATRFGNFVTMTIPQLQATSNSTTATLDGVPAALLPASTNYCPIIGVTDNGIDYPGQINVSSTASWTLKFRSTLTSVTGVFTALGTKGTSGDISFTYSLQ